MSPKKLVSREVFAAPQNAIQFRISEVSKMLGISPSTLRQWEVAGLTRPSRTRGGYRTFSFEQVELLKYIRHLRTDKGLNIEAVRHMLGKNVLQNRPAPQGTSRAEGHPIGRKTPATAQRAQDHAGAGGRGNGTVPKFFELSLNAAKPMPQFRRCRSFRLFYKSSVLSLFETKGSNNHHRITNLVRPHQRKKISNQPGVKIELLAVGKIAMEAHIFHLGPGVSSGGSYHHEGEEFIFILKGTCDIWLDEVEHYLLRAGDCL